jgi:formylglycine-generating enzyme required for sulfatase activity
VSSIPLLVSALWLATGDAEMARVGPGRWVPFWSEAGAAVAVPGFWLDRAPVSNAAFLAFVREHPTWRRDQVSRVFAGEGYLGHWAAPLALVSAAQAREPVVQVSWFAAEAYCESRGARLPTTAEWELAAQASEDASDASQDPAFRRLILDWYARPATEALRPAGSGRPNYWGVRDLHGLVWEWVLDFNSELSSDDGRAGGDAQRSRFCGGAALSARDASDYASFMRFAMRGALEASYTTSRLGFRCARDQTQGAAR